MAKKKPQKPDTGFVLYDILYEDGARTSNRKVPSELANGYEGEGPIRGYIEEQDRKIAEMSGNPRGPIKTISRSA